MNKQKCKNISNFFTCKDCYYHIKQLNVMITCGKKDEEE